jgi:hypothetical protein
VLYIEIAKRADGVGLLRCTRQGGSVTWQKQIKHAAHFALHDLTHYAVETALGYRRGFFGLIAAGCDLEDTTGKGARGHLPGEAIEVERIVGLFDSEGVRESCGRPPNSMQLVRAYSLTWKFRRSGPSELNCFRIGLRSRLAVSWN